MGTLDTCVELEWMQYPSTLPWALTIMSSVNGCVKRARLESVVLGYLILQMLDELGEFIVVE